MNSRQILILLSIVIFGLTNCKKKEKSGGKIPELRTKAVSTISGNTAECGGIIIADGGNPIGAKGVCWSTNETPTISDDTTLDGSGPDNFASKIKGLAPSTKYYVRAYATNSGGTGYGEVNSFTTLAPELPVLTTNALSNITTNSASTGGEITFDGYLPIIERGICWSTSTNPRISDQKITEGNGIGSFSSTLTNLTPNTIYYIRAYATNKSGTAYGNQVYMKTFTGTATDIEGNVYFTVTIGTQVWLVENLKTTKYNNGDQIPMITDATQWSKQTTGAWCNYDNNPANGSVLGKLYNWYTVNDSRGIAPKGFHVPSDAEWTTLTNYLGGESVAGSKLKEIGSTHWSIDNINATNSSGFTALPGSGRSETGVFGGAATNCNFWSSSLQSTTMAYLRSILDGDPNAYRFYFFRECGHSVRCIKD